MVHQTYTFATWAEAHAFQTDYLARYHPAGYATAVTITQREEGGYTVRVSRFSSCD